MAKIGRREKLKLRPELKMEFRDNPVFFNHLLKLILLAIEISDKTPEEAERIQKNFLDRH
ncbi:MAG: hypothetical protein PHF11_01375 [Candidatus Omnitrophica bacterium]|nr:hypothetical protein [Candidatus Omnitrophota bacterium]